MNETSILLNVFIFIMYSICLIQWFSMPGHDLRSIESLCSLTIAVFGYLLFTIMIDYLVKYVQMRNKTKIEN